MAGKLLQIAQAAVRKANLYTKAITSEEYGFLTGSDSGSWASSVPVTSSTAMRSWAFFACTRVLAESLGQTPFNLRKRTGPNSFEPAFDHRVNLVIQNPNNYMTSQQLRESAIVDLCVHGVAYWYKVVVRGELREIHPIDPRKVTPIRLSNRDIVYQVTFSQGDQRTVTSAELTRIVWFTDDYGLTPLSPIAAQQPLIASNISGVKQTDTGFKNKAQLGGVLQHPAKLSDKAHDNLKKSMRENYSGENAFNTLILEEDMKYQQTTMNNKDAQFLELIEASAEWICGILRVPTQKIGISSKLNYSNAEHFGRVFVEDSLQHHSVRLTDAVNIGLLTKEDRLAGYYAYQDLSDFMRGDAESRAKVHQMKINTGQENFDEARSDEGKNPLPNDEGKKRLLPLSYAIVDEEGNYTSLSQVTGLEPGEGATAQPVPDGNDEDDNGDESDEQTPE